jgi:hypothetical protein
MPGKHACVRSKRGRTLLSEHTVNAQCLVRSSWLVEAAGTPVAARFATALVDCHIVLEELEPDEGL